MIDLHTHFLPGLDDGPATLAEALEMAAVAQEEGFHSVVATPHYLVGHYQPEPAQIRQGVDALQQAARRLGLQITFHPGAELHLVEDLVQRLQRGELLTLNDTRYLLLELPFEEFPLVTGQVLFELTLAGYQPVLAHAERYRPLQDNPTQLFHWSRSGVLAQVTTGSLVGEYGGRAHECARTLLTHGLAQFLATDAHDVGRRAPRAREALQVASQWLGEERAEALLQGNPARVLVGEQVTIQAEEPGVRRARRGRRSWWQRWRAGG